MGLLRNFASRLNDEQSYDIDNEIAEASLITIENLIRKCPNEAKIKISEIYQLSSLGLIYDPNYQYNEDEDDDQDQDMDDTEDKWGDSDFDDINDDDDDDTAWKVRKGAIKLIDAIIVTCPMQLKEFWFKYLDLLQKRFMERDDNVKCEILETCQTLIKSSLKPDDEHFGEYQSQKVSQFEDQINQIYPSIIKNLLKQFKSKNIKVKVATMKTISVLSMVLP